MSIKRNYFKSNTYVLIPLTSINSILYIILGGGGVFLPPVTKTVKVRGVTLFFPFSALLRECLPFAAHYNMKAGL